MKGNFHVRLFEGLELVTVSAYSAIDLYRPYRTRCFFIVTQASLRSTWAVILRPSRSLNIGHFWTNPIDIHCGAVPIYWYCPYKTYKGAQLKMSKVQRPSRSNKRSLSLNFALER